MSLAALPIPAPWVSTIRSSVPVWLPVWLGLAILYIPTVLDLSTGHWSQSDQAHGPLILALALWMMWRKWPDPSPADKPHPAAGWCMVAIGLLAYIVGRSQAILILEIGSSIWLIAGFIAMHRGLKVLGAVWFSLFLMCFLLPLPGTLVPIITLPMKLLVSWITEHILYAAGYPISRSGVVLQIGYYQLLVADACAGVQTVLTLEAMGLLYMNVVRHTSALRNIVLALFIIPISITANVIRVIALTLITYHLGDEAGQGFLHGFAGLVLFASALALIIALDGFLRTLSRPKSSPVPVGAAS